MKFLLISGPHINGKAKTSSKTGKHIFSFHKLKKHLGIKFEKKNKHATYIQR